MLPRVLVKMNMFKKKKEERKNYAGIIESHSPH